ncbi:hypothetical protein [Acidipila sp. EB88]|uniref:hypothetical protein n=1 Tax=Acidipila sp. EB88 TaxID=2305226 RepID=UPI000F5FAD30|nr:hypothetical protein [Acidipila sp. EB88]RRA48432.1 hypothetical protein D1Y84_09155 [Acidipila sp. EB88]
MTSFVLAAQSSNPLGSQPDQNASATKLSAPVPPPPPDAVSLPLTLHAYTNLIELPVLVLSRAHKALPPIGPEKFGVRLNGSPIIHPRYVRREGADPITLGIFIDVARNRSSFLHGLDEAISAIYPLLQPQDRVVFYGMGCKLWRTRVVSPVPDPQALTIALRNVLDRAESGSGLLTPCAQPVHLWDALVVVSQEITAPPGHRPVLLALTDGYDSGSSVRWPDLRRYANYHSVTLFGLVDQHTALPGGSVHESNFPLGLEGLDGFFGSTVIQSYLPVVTELTGGMVLRSGATQLPKTMARFIDLLRDRYILYFPRGADFPMGPVAIEVSDGRAGSFIRPAGASVPLSDPAVLSDPTTVPSGGR